MSNLFTELKRRNVFRVALVYVAISWLILQVADIVFDSFGTPDWVMKTLMFLLAIGFPLAILFAWAYEMTPEGLKREKDVDRSQSITHETGQKLNRTIIVVQSLSYCWPRSASCWSTSSCCGTQLILRPTYRQPPKDPSRSSRLSP